MGLHGEDGARVGVGITDCEGVAKAGIKTSSQTGQYSGTMDRGDSY